MDLFDAIKERHSYRGRFQDQPVPREDLRKIVEAGLLAPSGKNAQTTTFVIVDDPDLVARIDAMATSNVAMRDARAWIACIVDTQPEAILERHHFQYEDCAAAVENMLLAVTALGYATVWIDGWLRIRDRARLVGDLLGLPKGKTVRVLLPIGVPAEAYPHPEKMPFEERAWFNRYGG
jgi:nitroreductase